MPTSFPGLCRSDKSSVRALSSHAETRGRGDWIGFSHALRKNLPSPRLRPRHPPLKTLANENIAGPIIHALRERGHDVLSVKEGMRGASDKGILACEQDDGRLVVTQDKDFGELAFRRGLPAQCGIILLRTTGSNPESTRKRILELPEARNDRTGHFAAVTDRQIKLRLLPAPRQEKQPLNKTIFGECPFSGVSEDQNPAGWPLSSVEAHKTSLSDHIDHSRMSCPRQADSTS